MDLGSVILRGVTQIPVQKYHMFSLICDSYLLMFMYVYQCVREGE